MGECAGVGEDRIPHAAPLRTVWNIHLPRRKSDPERARTLKSASLARLKEPCSLATRTA